VGVPDLFRGHRRGRHRARGREALKVVDARPASSSTTEYDLGAARYVRTGEVLSDSVLDELRGQDAILLGAVGPPVGDTTVPPGTLERGLLLRLRFELDLYINLRPFTGVPGSIAAGPTSSSSGRTPRGPTPAREGSSARGRPPRWPPRDR
jgi:isocitrate/isopropylmalate dehydrogenase